MNFKISSLLLLSGLIFLTPVSFALDVLEYKFSNSYRYALLEDTSKEQFKGQYLLTSSLAHISSPFYIQNTITGNVYREVVKSYDLISLGASYRFNRQLQVILESALIKAKVLSEKETAVGDTHLKAKYIVWESKVQAFSLAPEIIFATGSEMAFTTRSNIGMAIRAIYEHHFDKLHFIGSLGYDHGNKNTYALIDNTDMLLAELGVSLDLVKGWNLNLETIRTFNTTSSTQDSQSGDIYLTLKNRTSIDFSTYAGLGIAGMQEPDKKNKTVFVGLKYHFGGTGVATKSATASKPVAPGIVANTETIEMPPPPSLPLRDQEDEKEQNRVYFNNN